MSRNPRSQAKVQYIVAVCRKSLASEDRQACSLPDQIKLNKQHYSGLPEEIRQRHPLHIIETAHTAFRPRQPYFLELCQMVERGEVYGVQAVSENRISRNHEDTGRFIQLLSDGQIPYFEVTNGKRYTGKNSSEIFVLCLEGAMSWKDSKDKGTVILQRMELKAAKGNHMGRKPFGFKPNTHFAPDGKEIRETLVDEERLPHAITMYKMMATGLYSLSDLELWAEKKKVRARPAENNSGGKLMKSAIAHILHDPFYKGEVWFNKKFQGKWTDTPPVSETLWNKVQIVMAARNNNTSRCKNRDLRRLFIYANVMRCGKCNGQLSPYRVVKKKTGKQYIYYECKAGKQCKTLVEQEKLLIQCKAMQDDLLGGKQELTRVRAELLALHKKKSAEEKSQRTHLTKAYGRLQEEIAQHVSELKDARDHGVEDIVKAKIKQLTTERDAIKAKIDQVHQDSSDWIEKAVQSFELLGAAREMLLHGSPQIRTSVLKAIASNYSLTDGKLVPDLRSPFREAVERGERPKWWAILDLNQ